MTTKKAAKPTGIYDMSGNQNSGRHKFSCQCEKCQQRRSRSQQPSQPIPSQSQPESQSQDQSPILESGIAPSTSDAPAMAQDDFEATVAEISQDAPELVSPALPIDAGTGTALAIPEQDAAARCLANLTPETAERWLQVPFNVAAAVLRNDVYKLTKDEVDMMGGAAHVLLEKHLPEMLRKSDSPELVMLGAGLVAYSLRVAGTQWQQKQENPEEPKAAKFGQETPAPQQQAPSMAARFGQD